MSAASDDGLPYSFDLLWDLKTTAQMIHEYLSLKTKQRDIEEVCAAHGIDLKVEIAGMADKNKVET